MNSGKIVQNEECGAVEAGEETGLIFWSQIIRILGSVLHHQGEGTVLLNSLLQVAEKAFKHNANHIRLAAYRSWMVLMDNFSRNHSVLTAPKRVKLIIRPLLVSCTNLLKILRREIIKSIFSGLYQQ